MVEKLRQAMSQSLSYDWKIKIILVIQDGDTAGDILFGSPLVFSSFQDDKLL